MTAAERVKPFPWTALDRTTRAAAQALRAARRWPEADVDVPAIPGAAAELLGARVALRLRSARPLAEASPITGAVGVLVSRSESPDVARSVLVVAEAALVNVVLARVLRRPAPRAIDPSAVPGAASAGAFAAIVAAVLRRAHASPAGAASPARDANTGTVRVLAAGAAVELESDVRRAAPDAHSLSLTALVDDDAFEMRVVVPPAAALATSSRAWTARDLAALGAMPLEVPVVACACTSTVAEVASLGVGDVLLPGSWALKRVPSGLAGPVMLAPAGHDVAIAAHLGDDGRLVLRGGAEATMDAVADKAELVDAMGDVPVVIRVEIGEARMPAREWARLGAGDVVALGRRIGEKVVLRVGGVPVARGDLVDVEGEVGVRIVERITGDESAP